MSTEARRALTEMGCADFASPSAAPDVAFDIAAHAVGESGRETIGENFAAIDARQSWQARPVWRPSAILKTPSVEQFGGGRQILQALASMVVKKSRVKGCF
jgi:hypothetical protein